MTEAGFQDIASAIQGVSGLALQPGQGYLLASRLGPVLRRHGLADLPALAQRLRAPGAAALAREVALATATHETSFFRDEIPFRHLAGEALPRLAAARPAGAALRLWSAACSSGQEACSLAIIAAEQRAALGGRAVAVLGTDLAPAMVARATAGLYSGFEIRRGLSEARRDRWFTAEGENWRAGPALRAACRFATANMVEEASLPGPAFDVILVRNLLIYLDTPTKERVVELCARRLAPEGLLYVGAAEVLLSLRTRLAPLATCHGAYRLDTPTARAFWEGA
ncbi:chemotaxis protein CheR [Roseomonas sp. GC11]|uniref:CheR family methyltransferase n=1 Tax=Roseomonas sp. GC11 TaxID=2950546 RepID=UPI00210AA74F|nr:CheR family methyltransferase [Roseomonas sp. GC11]MCQ4161975.1 chemotaxis protein CheR [Roseomonas sp. GC11]